MKNLFKICFAFSFLFILACGSSSSTDDGGSSSSALEGRTYTVDPDSDLTGQFHSCPLTAALTARCDLNEATEIEFVDDDTVIVYFEDGDYETGEWVYVDSDSFDTTFGDNDTSWTYTITGTTILMENADSQPAQQADLE